MWWKAIAKAASWLIFRLIIIGTVAVIIALVLLAFFDHLGIN